MKPILKFNCPMSWDKMQPDGNGRNCGACQRKIEDMTALTAEEIHEKIRNANGEICGKFRASQLIIPAAVGASLFGAPAVTQAQTQNEINALQPEHAETAPDPQWRGVVYNEDRQPVNQTYIFVYDGDKLIARTETHADGYFILYMHNLKVTQGVVVVKYFSEGYEPLEEVVSVKNRVPGLKRVLLKKQFVAENEADLSADTSAIELMEVVISTEDVYEGHLLGVTISPRFKYDIMPIEEVITDSVAVQAEANEVFIFPNPANEFTTVRMNHEGKYDVLIFATDGKLVYQEGFVGTEFRVYTTALPPANYLVTVVNRENNLRATDKLVITR